jgi:hypothetical protein
MSSFNRYNDPDHFRGNYSIPEPTPEPTPAPNDESPTYTPNLGFKFVGTNLRPSIELTTDYSNQLNLGPLDIVMPDPSSGKNVVVTMPDNFEDMINNGELDGMTLYPIINGAVGFGEDVKRILEDFTVQDVPFGETLGISFDARGNQSFFRPTDVGATVQETIFDVGNFLEDWVARPVSGFFGELTGGAKGRKKFTDFDFVPTRSEVSISKLLSIPGMKIQGGPTVIDKEGEPIKDFSGDLAEIEAGINKEAIENSLLGKPFEEDPFAAATREALKDVKDKKPVGEGEDEIAEGEEGTEEGIEEGTEGADDDKTGGKDLSDTKPVGFFGSDKFLSAIRNVGKSLVEQGQFGSGLALGAVGFADEQAQRQLLAEQRQAEINQLILEASLKGQEVLDEKVLESLSGYEAKINQNARYFQGGQVAIGFMDIIIKEIVDNPGKIGGLQGFIDSSVQKISNFLNMDTPWETMSAQAKVEALAKVVQQGNLQAILGESGRTISDKDREIVKDVFGTPGLFDNPDTALTKLRASRDKLAYENQERKRNIISDFTKIQMPVYRQPGQIATLQLTPIVQLIQGSDPYSPNSSNVGNLTATIKTIPLRPKD